MAHVGDHAYHRRSRRIERGHGQLDALSDRVLPRPKPSRHGFVDNHYGARIRSEEHTSELQSRSDLVCRLLLEKKKKKQIHVNNARNRLWQTRTCPAPIVTRSLVYFSDMPRITQIHVQSPNSTTPAGHSHTPCN